MNSFFPERIASASNWSIPNLNRYNRDSSLPMNYGDYHTINTNAALKQFSEWKKNGNANAVKPLLDLTKKNNTKNTINNNNSNNNNNNTVIKGLGRHSITHNTVSKKALSIKDEDELKVEDVSINNNNNNKIIITKPLIQVPSKSKPIHQIKQIIPSETTTQQTASLPTSSFSTPSTISITTNESQSSSSTSSSTTTPPSAMFYLFFFIASFDEFDDQNHTPASSSSLSSSESSITILFEISINQQQLLQMEALHDILLSLRLSSSSSMSSVNDHHTNYQTKFRMSSVVENFNENFFEFAVGDRRWEISVGDG